jgi:mRNA interferase MazF
MPPFPRTARALFARRKAEIAVDQMRTISKDRLGKRLDHLSVADAARIRRLIVEMYGE